MSDRAAHDAAAQNSADRQTEPAEREERRVSWAELSFDLVFVFAVTDVSALLVSVTRLVAAAVVLVVLPLLSHVAALDALIGLAAVVGVLNTVELLRAEHSGWRARPSRRAGRKTAVG